VPPDGSQPASVAAGELYKALLNKLRTSKITYFGPLHLVYAEGVNAFFGVSLACALAISAWAQGSGEPIPRFQDYPAFEIFKGTAALPIFTRPEERLFRTVIRQGVTKGYGVFRGAVEQEKPGPNFAGHYIAIQWGCGSDCDQMAIVDANTGHIYPPPLRGKGSMYFNVPIRSFQRRPDFRLDSRLMILSDACPQPISGCSAYYFLWDHNQWKLVYRKPEN
jgi:hypothetical protein